MDLGIAGKVALVTGSTRGLGRSVAEALAAEGASVMICARTASRVDETVRTIAEAAGTPVHGIAVDLAEVDDVDRLAKNAVASFGRVDILVHVVGGPKLGGLHDTSADEWHRQMQLHFHSLRQLVTDLVPGMASRGWGRVVAVTSRTVRPPRADNVVSGAVRMPAVSLLRALSEEYGPDGVTFNTVCPGPFATERLRDVAEQLAEQHGTSPDEQMRQLAKGVAVGRVGQPAELGAVCAFLSSSPAAFMTGQTLLVDGGSVRIVL